MHLKRIELAGFKSFADRTVIEFESGVTAVVGPNGSGKSNITEAIRWVMGEQSAKNLRGGKMPDIIFAGSEGRKALNIAEVTIVLDNSDHYLALDFTEVSVTRRYRRTGESDFFINKQSCRLKDIQELFMDSGLGKESFSIISQGKVEAIFNSKPEDRRGIFEEAAGVLKYKQRKKKAEQKLFETEDNLNRVQDIIFELEDQLTPLIEQREAAQQYLKLDAEHTKLDAGVTAFEIGEQKVIWDQKHRELIAAEEELLRMTQTIQRLEADLSELRTSRKAIDDQMEREQSQLLQLTAAYEQAEGQKNVLQERSQNTARTVEEYEASLAEITEKRIKYQEDLAQFEVTYAERTKALQLVELELKETELLLQKYSKSSKELLEELRSQYVEVMQQQANTANDLKYLERQYQQETAKNQQAMTRYEALVEQMTAAEKEQAELQTALSAVEAKLAEQLQQYADCQKALSQAQQKLEQSRQNMYQAMNRMQQTQARQKSLQDIQDNYSGYYQGVQAVLKHKDQIGGVIGAVAELIEVPKEFTTAIEIALGGAAQHIVVANEQDGQRAIAFLKKQRVGRATFLPLTTIKPRVLSQHIAGQVDGADGFIGIASDLIAFSEQVSNVVRNLLGTTLIARDLTTANQLARKVNYQCRVVSLEGDVMNPGGSMTGGSNRRGKGSLFGQAQELEELTKALAAYQKQLTDHEQDVKQQEQIVAELQAQLEQLRQEGETIRLTQQDQQNQLSNQAAQVERFAKERKLFDYETRELQDFLSSYETKKAQLAEAQEQLATQKVALDEEMLTINQEASQNEARKEETTQRLSKQRAEAAVLREQLQQQTLLVEEKQELLAEVATKETSLRNHLQLLTNNSTDHFESGVSLTTQLEQLGERKVAIQQSLDQAKEERRGLQTQVDQKDLELNRQNKTQQELLTKKSRIEVAKNRAEVSLDTALQHLQEEYSLTYEAAQEKYPLALPLEEAKIEVRRLKRAIEQLGPVNLNAIEQFEQVNERHEFLVRQRDDLLQAKDQLFDTMAEMDQEVEVRFGEVFEAIRLQFKQVFPSMFGGGRAELILTDPNDLLNTGIEIEAQPPGKKLQSLGLLSGGERALTAIALLFSIIRVRPVPFCVLDEVEAALDEANVARFGHYLSAFEDDTQFIVVTHRKGTMEAADVLYGVTMQESGVSKTVSVRLEEIKEGGSIEQSVT